MSYVQKQFNYRNYLQEIKIEMSDASKNNSIASFAREHKLNEANLSRIFSETAKNPQEMSTGTFIRIAVALGYGTFDEFYLGLETEKERRYLNSMPLSVFFKLNHNKISQTFMTLGMS